MGLFGKTETDPVCKMKVDPKTSKLTYTWQGKAFYFCSAGCKSKFEATPERYLTGGAGGSM